MVREWMENGEENNRSSLLLIHPQNKPEGFVCFTKSHLWQIILD